MPNEQFSAIWWREQATFDVDDDNVRFVLDQHVYGYCMVIALTHW
jgi:hypothetical protein